MIGTQRSFHGILAGFLAAFLLLPWVGVTCARAQALPGTMNFQGRLTDASNNPLSGPHDLRFELYDVSVGGSALWSETRNGVVVTNGVVAIQLGALAPMSGPAFYGADRYLQVIVDGTPLTPREKLASVPFAFSAGALEGRGYLAFVSTDAAAQSIAGAKTFTGALTVPAPTLFSGSAADPAGSAGALYYNSASNKLRLHIGSGFVDIATGTAGAGGAAYTADELSLHLAGGQFSALSSSVTLQGNSFNAADRLVKLDASGRLPAVNASLLTNLPAASGPIAPQYIDLSTVTAALAGKMGLGAVAPQYVDLSTVTTALAGKIGTGTNIPPQNVDLSTVTAALAGKMGLGAVAPQYVDLSTVTTALAGKIGTGTNIPPQNVDLSTVTAALNLKLTSGAVPADFVDLSTVTTALAGKMGLGAVAPQYVDLSTVATALASRVARAGDGMTGSLTMLGNSTVTVQGDAFSVGGATFAVASGLVGMGTASPGGRLHVRSAVGSHAAILETSDGGTYPLILRRADAPGQDVNIYNNGAQFWVQQGAYFGGSVGIGTQGPAAKLDVEGDAQFGAGAAKSTFAAAGYLTLANLGAAPAAAPGRLYYDSTGEGALMLRLNAGGFVALATGTAGAGLSSVNADGTQFSGLGTGVSPLLLQSSSVTLQGNVFNAADRLVKLDASGRLPAVNASLLTNLPAASSPVAPQYVDLSTVTTALNLKLTSGPVPADFVDLSTVVAKAGDGMTGPLTMLGNSTITVQGDAFSVGGGTLAVVNGRVGIGTVSPASALDVRGEVRVAKGFGVVGFDSLDVANALLYLDPSIDRLNVGHNQLSMSLRVRNQDRLIALAGGDVGIGVSPSYRLHVASGAGEAGDILVVSTGASNVFRVNGQGEVRANKYYGDGSQLTGLTGGSDRVLRAGDGMTGPLTMLGNSTITVQGDAFSVGGGTFVIVNGRVGVGTADPGVLLSLYAAEPSITLTGSEVGSTQWQMTSGGDLGITKGDFAILNQSDGGTPFRIVKGAGSNNALAIKKGSVGIGTTAPTARMHISSGTGETGDILVISTGSSDIFRVTGQGEVYANKYYGDGSALTGVSGGADKVAKAGDGMTGPLTMLGNSTITVQGDAFSVGGSTLVVGGGVVRMGSQAVDFGLGATGRILGINNDSGHSQIFLGQSPTAHANLVWVYNASEDLARIDFGPRTAHSLNLKTNNSARQTILGNGQVGIGTQVPAARLHVSSASAVAADTILQVSSGTDQGQELLVVKGDGKVGIGKSNPTAALDVFGIMRTSGSRIESVGVTDYHNHGLRMSTGSTNLWQLAPGGGFFSLSMWNGATWKDWFNIGATGRVGIGTTNPGAQLQSIYTLAEALPDGIAYFDNRSGNTTSTLKLGDSTTADTRYLLRAINDSDGDAGGPGDVFAVRADGKVGIGTGTPNGRLHVAEGASNLRFGHNLSAGSGGPSLMLETASNVYADVMWRTFDAEQVRLRGSSYGLAIGGTNPRLNIGYADANYTNAALVVNGNVGIGMTDPGGYKVNVAGSLNATEIRVNGTVLSPGTGSNWTVSGSDVYRGAGKVGIGTAVPQRALDIAGSNVDGNLGVRVAPTGASGYGPYVTLNATSLSGGRSWVLASGGDLDAGGVLGKFAVMDNSAGGAARLVIDPAARVGVGTTSPTARLHVSSANAVAGDSILIVSSGTSTGQELLVVKGNGSAGFGTANPAVINGNSLTGTILQARGSGTDMRLAVEADGRSVIDMVDRSAAVDSKHFALMSYGGRLRFFSVTDAFAGAERISLLPGGNLGVSISSPTATFEVNGTAILSGPYGLITTTAPAPYTATGVQLKATPATPYVAAFLGTNDQNSAFIVADVNANKLLNVRGDGSIGIGTQNPTAKLHIAGTPGVDGIRFPDGTLMTSAGAGSASSLSNAADAVINADSDADNAGAVRLQTKGSDRLVILNGGAVGINTGAPSQALDVNGSINIGAGSNLTQQDNAILRLSDNANTVVNPITAAGKVFLNWDRGAGTIFGNGSGAGGEIARLLDDGKFGLGTNVPAARLHVSSANALAADTLFYVSSGALASQAVMAAKGDGKVGIGTLSPSQRLHVRVSAESTEGLLVDADDNNRLWLMPSRTAGGSNALTQTGDSSLIFSRGVIDTGALVIGPWASQGVGLRLKQNGQVGLGLADAQARLHISSGAGETGNILVVSTGSSDVFRVTGQGEVYANKLYGDGSALTGVTGGSDRVLRTGDGMTGPLTMLGNSTVTVQGDAFSVGGSTLVVASGRLGIGAANPQRLLHVYGAAGGESAYVETDSASPAAGVTLEIDKNLATQYGNLNYRTAGNLRWSLGMFADENLSVVDRAYSDAKVMVFKPATGNVGVGVQSPAARLHVSSANAAAADNLFYVSSGTLASEALLSVKGSGNVGIGTLNPSDRLHVRVAPLSVEGVTVHADDGNTVSIGPSRGVGGSNPLVQAGDSSLIFSRSALNTGALVIGPWANFGSGLRLKQSGQIGLGVSDAQARLHVSSANAVAADMVLLVSSGTGQGQELLVVKGGGKVGIGTASPSTKLSVSGGGISTDDYLAVSGAYPRLQLTGDESTYKAINLIDSTSNEAWQVSHRVGVAEQNKFQIGYFDGSTWQTPHLTMVTSGNVGIGTVSPAYKFDVAGTLNAQEVRVNGVVLNPGTGSNWTVSGADIYRNGGNVGVGTTSPANRLQIGSVGGYASNDIAIGNGTQAMALYQSPTASNFYTNTNFAFLAAGGPGKVGVGTGAPAARLHVSSGAGEGGDILVVSTGASNVFRVTGQGEVYANKLYGDGSALTGVAGGSDRVLRAGDGMTGPLTMLGNSTITVQGDAFSVGGSTLVVANGKVGIGTTAPINLLHVQDPRGASGGQQVATFESTRNGATDGTYVYLKDNTGGAAHGSSLGSVNGNLILQTSGGNVGVGLIPGAGSRLHVQSSGGDSFPFRITTSLGGWGAYFYETSTHDNFLAIQNSAQSDAVRLQTNGASFLNGGNVGIGTTNPGYKLDVVGTMNAQEVRVNGVVLNPGTGSNWTVSGADIYRNGGNVGIGTTNPGTLLHVQVPLDTVKDGAHIGNGSAGMWLGNATASGFVPIIKGKGSDSNDRLVLTMAASAANDTGSYPMILVNGERDDGSAVQTRPLFAVGNAWNTKLIVDNAGNVGIGITSPDPNGLGTRLNVAGPAGNPGRQELTGNTADGDGVNAADLFFSAASQTGATLPQGGTRLAGLRAHTAGGTANNRGGALAINVKADNGSLFEAVRVASTGYVGFGTTAPSQRLHVVGGSSLSPSVNPNSPIVVEGTTANGNVNIQVIAANNKTSSILFADPDSSVNPGYSGALSYDHAANSLGVRTNADSTYKMFLGASGDLGVGSSAPAARLHVSSANAVAADTILQVSSGTAQGQELLVVKGDGKVGIGTTSPGPDQLSILKDVDWVGVGATQLRLSGAAVPAKMMRLGYSTTGDFGLIQAQEAGVGFKTLALQPNGGGLGIGTTNPKLTLVTYSLAAAPTNSGTTPTGNNVFESNGSSLYFGSYAVSPWGYWMQAADRTNLSSLMPIVLNPLGGNVGIRTSSPNAPLEVKADSNNDGIRIQSNGGNYCILRMSETTSCSSGTLLGTNGNRALCLICN